jgi:hypothetical protein
MIRILAVLTLIAVAAAGGSANAAGREDTPVAAAWHAKATKTDKKRTRTRYVRAPSCAPVGPDPLCPSLRSYNPCNPSRGFCDPGFAYHGNIVGCAIDLGYGRWEPCNASR